MSSYTWDNKTQPSFPDYRPINYLIFIVRWILIAITIYGLLMLLFLVRLFEFPWGRPVSPYIVRAASRISLRIIGLKLIIKGQPLTTNGAIVSNHVSWLDIFVCSSAQNALFVAKSEIATWLGIGILAKATGTIFLDRNPRQALNQKKELTNKISKGYQLLFFPEGTSTDGLRVLNFKTTLFSIFYSQEIGIDIEVQPMTIRYLPNHEHDETFYGFWGDLGFGSHFFKVVSAKQNGVVELICHRPVKASKFHNRKELAAYCEAKVREGLATELTHPLTTAT